MIPLARPDLGEREIAAAVDVLQSGMLVQGRVVTSFEEALAEACQRKHAVAVANGTAALYLALKASGVQAQHRVAVPALTWPSPAHATLALGAEVVPCDIDAETWNVSEASLSSDCDFTIVIDQFGNPLSRSVLAKLDPRKTIEDAACAIGSRFASGKPCGSLGLASCLSFHPRKVLTTGEGGAVLTDDEGLADELRRLRNHGQSSPGEFAFAALNWRLTEMQAAIGLVQLTRLPDILSARQRAAACLRQAIVRRVGDALRFAAREDGAVVNEQTFGVVLPAGVDRERFLHSLRESGVQAGRLSYALTRIGTLPHAGSAPMAEDVDTRGVTLPLFSSLSELECEQIAIALEMSLASYIPGRNL